ncbi:MAG: 4-hydroxythreonine-4-phosphate dehydrogenase PdxA [Pseudomonadota bacterium]|nr:4-hydroxythreonine-4-phosphate dehydrogenase PdxA [Pseudomonadota bacterium]
MTAPPLVVTPGDPRGIGPEVAVRALRTLDVDAVLFGDIDALRVHAPELQIVDSLRPGRGLRALVLPSSSEPVEVVAIREAVRACLDGTARALVTGPIHKARLAARGFGYPGHTELLGALCGVDEPVMAFVGGSVRVALVTVHLPLREVPDAVTRAKVLHTLRTADRALRERLGFERPRLAVCGLNPHAGDAGLLGREEIDIIGPACADARALGLDVWGPISAETAFYQADRSDMVVAMYHDQGLAPLKRVDFGRSVNWTLGLPIVRTSVDHGTADELVGTGKASAASMEAAIELALQLTDGR